MFKQNWQCDPAIQLSGAGVKNVDFLAVLANIDKISMIRFHL